MYLDYMPRKKKELNDKIFSYPVCLRGGQISWIESHPEIKINKFFRDQLDKLIIFKTKVANL